MHIHSMTCKELPPRCFPATWSKHFGTCRGGVFNHCTPLTYKMDISASAINCNSFYWIALVAERLPVALTSIKNNINSIL